MTEPSRPRPVPGPPVAPRGPAPGGTVPGSTVPGSTVPSPALAGLGDLPVAEHVAVLEAEHARLQRELASIDQL
ncbi:hypothetical protein [Geodermatophilus marinus]|uniref:hypothetical protein n=1 Tax=Geodermatophilus sp. LHW52908 TaxID=2303986 RepID=UPI000E3D0627|nr:hypothetical protein [Geodermatophilus sp. LHW52908]RFU19261.1 hypothetical protein D0Z06_22490 [Geodermatophilus sp. LHW52908]